MSAPEIHCFGHGRTYLTGQKGYRALFTFTSAEAAILCRVLIPNPAKDVRYFSFYESQCKSAREIVKAVREVKATGRTESSQYMNALRHQFLIVEDGTSNSLTTLGEEVLRIAGDTFGAIGATGSEQDRDDAAELGASLVGEADSTGEVTDVEIAENVDYIIFKHLVSLLAAVDEIANKDPIKFFAERFRNVQRVIWSIPPAERSSAAGDEDLIFILQAINLEEAEIRRYFSMSTAERALFRTAADKARSQVRPNDAAPTTYPEDMIFAYFRRVPTSGSRIIQKGAGPRAQSFMKAYLRFESESGETLPVVDDLWRVTSGKARQRQSTQATPLPEWTEPRQLIMTGCPGSGKSKTLDNLARGAGCVIFRTIFHSETSYYDLVGSYKPAPVYEKVNASFEDGTGSPFLLGRPVIDYRFVPGPFAACLAAAVANPSNRYMLIIEEINRANASAVFGDILQLLDRTSEGMSEYGVQPSPEFADFLIRSGANLDDGLRLPSNFYIWATMNSADQGVFPLDAAFRRRWEFKHQGFETNCAYGQETLLYGGQDMKWDDFRKHLNDHLINEVSGIHEDKLIGPYFLTQVELKDPERVRTKLFHYLWDDVLRHQPDAIFKVSNLSSLKENWKQGAGAPLKVTFKESEV